MHSIRQCTGIHVSGIKHIDHKSRSKEAWVPPYNPRSNGSAERAVQTVKSALKCWNEFKLHYDFNTYLQKILFHHRISSNSRGKSPAEIIFGRQLRAPITTKYQQGQPIWYKANTDTQPVEGKFVMTKGNNTSIVIFDNNNQSHVTLVGNNQISSRNDNPRSYDPNTSNEPSTTSNEDLETESCRRSLRQRQKTRCGCCWWGHILILFNVNIKYSVFDI